MRKLTRQDKVAIMKREAERRVEKLKVAELHRASRADTTKQIYSAQSVFALAISHEAIARFESQWGAEAMNSLIFKQGADKLYNTGIDGETIPMSISYPHKVMIKNLAIAMRSARNSVKDARRDLRAWRFETVFTKARDRSRIAYNVNEDRMWKRSKYRSHFVGRRTLDEMVEDGTCCDHRVPLPIDYAYKIKRWGQPVVKISGKDHFVVDARPYRSEHMEERGYELFEGKALRPTQNGGVLVECWLAKELGRDDVYAAADSVLQVIKMLESRSIKAMVEDL